jgi:Glycogen synthase
MYQGRFSKYSFERMGYDIGGYDLNFMEIGIGYADVVNTVSPTYAEEIKYPYFAEGLEWITNTKKIYGILNGIDVDEFDPEKNPDIIPFNKDSLDKKKENKYRLQEKLGLPKSDVALISLVTRLVEGKGLDLVSAVLENLLQYDAVQVVILGSGDRFYEDYYNYLTNKYPDKFKVYLGYNPHLANEIYAGSDIFLMPSRYEPCGLSQMIAMRFGTIPVVRETGGLKDTVHPYNVFTNEGNGFSFTNFNADDMLYTIKVAEGIYYDRPEVWKDLIRRNMEADFSWDKAAREYVKLYEEAKTH